MSVPLHHYHNNIIAILLKTSWTCVFCNIATVYDICRLQTADCRLQTAGCRLQTGDCRLQTADCKLNDTENPPNKGDVFKNIKWCESSLGNKVDIFVQSYIGLIPKMLLAILHRPFIISPGISLIALILHSSLIIVN